MWAVVGGVQVPVRHRGYMYTQNPYRMRRASVLGVTLTVNVRARAEGGGPAQGVRTQERLGGLPGRNGAGKEYHKPSREKEAVGAGTVVKVTDYIQARSYI